jgi:hypothetical protein
MASVVIFPEVLVDDGEDELEVEDDTDDVGGAVEVVDVVLVVVALGRVAR